jgi:transposase
MIVGALGMPVDKVGITEASTTRRPATARTNRYIGLGYPVCGGRWLTQSCLGTRGSEWGGLRTCPMARQRFTAEFKRDAVMLLERGDKPVTQLAAEFGVPRNRHYKWRDALRAHNTDAFLPGSECRSPQQLELMRLQRELAQSRKRTSSQHFTVLRGNACDGTQTFAGAQGLDHRKQFDRVGAGPEHDEDSLGYGSPLVKPRRAASLVYRRRTNRYRPVCKACGNRSCRTICIR